MMETMETRSSHGRHVLQVCGRGPLATNGALGETRGETRETRRAGHPCPHPRFPRGSREAVDPRRYLRGTWLLYRMHSVPLNESLPPLRSIWPFSPLLPLRLFSLHHPLLVLFPPLLFRLVSIPSLILSTTSTLGLRRDARSIQLDRTSTSRASRHTPPRSTLQAVFPPPNVCSHPVSVTTESNIAGAATAHFPLNVAAQHPETHKPHKSTS